MPSPAPFTPGAGLHWRRRLAYDTVPRITGVDPSSSRLDGGGSVTITGFNFRLESDGSAPVVLFGANAATNVVVVDARTITCDVPVATDDGIVDISVTISSQTGTGRGIFTYFESAITRIIPNYGMLAGGMTIMLEGFNFLTGSSVTIGGVSATGVLFIDSQHIQCVAPAATDTGFVDVVVTDP